MSRRHRSTWVSAQHWLLCLLCLLAGYSAPAAEYRPLPPALRSGLSPDWLIHDEGRNRLVLYLPDYHAPAHAYYQWLTLRPQRPFIVSFTARSGQSLFLDNRLVFTAPKASDYTLDLARLLPAGSVPGPHLLCVWHPQVAPNLSSFVNVRTADPTAQPGLVKTPAAQLLAQPLARSHPGENVFLLFLLLIGLLYGSIRAVYQPGFARIYQVDNVWSKSTAEQEFLVKPTVTWLNILLVLVFSLSFALLLVAIHTNVQNIAVLQRLFDVPESALVLRILLYTATIAAFVMGKYLFLELMGYIFDVGELVVVQYREFIRTLLFLGLCLPLVMLLYLGLNQTLPAAVLWVSNGVVSLLLVGTVIRVARTIHRRSSLLNLHLFSYLCATEVIPLVILLKLIVFTY
ncbi:DUF4271 domain-containing protein [Hymenobacter yonginensis]|uniref:DUF4271 domain-containing protein n=1 Tax=Hymenobacter yonginensis TaxID=748197 RepID=A0ABY7PQJ8_9BACT|nr:DUF4271 domain-containing protein [Hymenobacter yonginensis]WBO84420.1 DUF4271 domain-containing protein [Hymenobacter yonginensis]